MTTRELFATTHLKLDVGLGGIDYNEARRDKYMQMEVLKSKGVLTMRQILTDDEYEALDFYDNISISDNKGAIVVIKPTRGSASVAVSKCSSKATLLEAFRRTLGIPGYANGTASDAILV